MDIFLIATASVLFVAVVVSVVFIIRLSSEKASLVGREQALEARLQERTDAARAAAEEREKLFETQRKQMEESFKALSEQNSSGLRRQNAESMGELLKPIREKFECFEKQIKESGEKSTERDILLQASIRNMVEQSRSVGEEARNLANALTGKSKVQGDFGEMLLGDLLRQSGLEEGVHYVTQGVLRDAAGHEIKSDSGATMIPDVVVNYPDGGQVVIDSKVSLTAFVNYVNASSVEDRKRFAKAHIDSISKHVDELKIKDYASYIEDEHKKVDYNIMFIPVENAYRLMLDEAPTLWHRAKDAKVLIVSQQNLMIVLNMILMTWKQHDQQKNIADVYKTAEELMGQLKNWMESFVKVGENLDKARSAYDDSRRKLVESNQSVIRKIDKLEHLKLAPRRSNAKLKAGARIVGGQESVIPNELSKHLEYEENYDIDADAS